MHHGSVKDLGLCCELDDLLSQAAIPYRDPDLKHAMGSLRRPAHLPSLIHSCVDKLIDRVFSP